MSSPHEDADAARREADEYLRVLGGSLDAVQSAARDESAAGRSGDLGKITAALVKANAACTSSADRLARVRAPERLAAGHARVIASLEHLAEAGRHLVDATRRNRAHLRGTIAEYERAGGDVRAAIEEQILVARSMMRGT